MPTPAPYYKACNSGTLCLTSSGSQEVHGGGSSELQVWYPSALFTWWHSYLAMPPLPEYHSSSCYIFNTVLSCPKNILHEGSCQSLLGDRVEGWSRRGRVVHLPLPKFSCPHSDQLGHCVSLTLSFFPWKRDGGLWSWLLGSAQGAVQNS